MNLKDKWLEQNSAADLVTMAAARALRQRIAVVWYHHPRAALCSGRDVEYVHQLRVATRRTVAVIDVFSDVFASRERKTLKKSLAKIRASAGKARDLDVLILQLQHDPTVSDSEKRICVDALRSFRHAAQGKILRCARKVHQGSLFDKILEALGASSKVSTDPRFMESMEVLLQVLPVVQHGRLDRRLRKLTRSIRWRGSDSEPTLGQYARTMLETRFHKLFAQASGDLDDFDKLHLLRIEIKKVRYAMELLAAGFSNSFRQKLYPRIEDLQKRLGHINDYAAASARCKHWLQQLDGDTSAWEKLAAAQDRRAEQAADEFLAWWTPNRVNTCREVWQAVAADA